MIISREQDYAIRILRVLVDGEKHNIGSLCESEFIPVPFGRKLVTKLERNGVLRCERGRNGGVILVKDLHDISLLELLSMLDDKMYVNACLDPSHDCEWKKEHNGKCCVHHNLGKLQLKLQNALDDIDVYSVVFDELAV